MYTKPAGLLQTLVFPDERNQKESKGQKEKAKNKLLQNHKRQDFSKNCSFRLKEKYSTNILCKWLERVIAIISPQSNDCAPFAVFDYLSKKSKKFRSI